MVLWEGEDAGYVVPFGGFLFFAEVADEMASMLVTGGHAVEEEGIDVVIECFVIEEEFTQEAEIAAPAALAAAVDFEEGDGIVTVNLVTRGVKKRAFGAVAGEGLKGGVVAEAEFTDIDRVC